MSQTNVVKCAMIAENARLRCRIKKSKRAYLLARQLGTLHFATTEKFCDVVPCALAKSESSTSKFSYNKPRLYTNEKKPEVPHAVTKQVPEIQSKISTVNEDAPVVKKTEEKPKSRIYSTPESFLPLSWFYKAEPEQKTEPKLEEAEDPTKPTWGTQGIPQQQEQQQQQQQQPQHTNQAWSNVFSAESPLSPSVEVEQDWGQGAIDKLSTNPNSTRAVKKRKKRTCGAVVSNQWNWMTDQHKNLLLQAQINLSHLRSVGAPAARLQEVTAMIDQFVRSKGEVAMSLYNTLM